MNFPYSWTMHINKDQNNIDKPFAQDVKQLGDEGNEPSVSHSRVRQWLVIHLTTLSHLLDQVRPVQLEIVMMTGKTNYIKIEK